MYFDSLDISFIFFRMRFDIECMAGQHDDCPPVVMALGWANFIKALLAATLLSALMRYSDGANFVVIVLVRGSRIIQDIILLL